jgi:hypothetical protein
MHGGFDELLAESLFLSRATKETADFGRMLLLYTAMSPISRLHRTISTSLTVGHATSAVVVCRAADLSVTAHHQWSASG